MYARNAAALSLLDLSAAAWAGTMTHANDKVARLARAKRSVAARPRPTSASAMVLPRGVCLNEANGAKLITSSFPRNAVSRDNLEQVSLLQAHSGTKQQQTLATVTHRPCGRQCRCVIDFITGPTAAGAPSPYWAEVAIGRDDDVPVVTPQRRRRCPRHKP